MDNKILVSSAYTRTPQQRHYKSWNKTTFRTVPIKYISHRKSSVIPNICLIALP